MFASFWSRGCTQDVCLITSLMVDAAEERSSFAMFSLGSKQTPGKDPTNTQHSTRAAAKVQILTNLFIISLRPCSDCGTGAADEVVRGYYKI